MKFFLLGFFYLFISGAVFSQAPFEDGYIVSNSGDTTKGKIKDRKYTAGDANSDKIKFIDTKGKESKITPDKVKGYGRKGNVVFRTLPIGLEGQLKFAQIIEYGDVILFGYKSNSFVSVVSDKSIEYFYQKRKDLNSLMKVKKERFESVSLFYFKDDAELIKKIEGKSLKYEDIRQVVQIYNEFAAKK
jgi:hypothetical protein